MSSNTSGCNPIAVGQDATFRLTPCIRGLERHAAQAPRHGVLSKLQGEYYMHGRSCDHQTRETPVKLTSSKIGLHLQVRPWIIRAGRVLVLFGSAAITTCLDHTVG